MLDDIDVEKTMTEEMRKERQFRPHRRQDMHCGPSPSRRDFSIFDISHSPHSRIQTVRRPLYVYIPETRLLNAEVNASESRCRS